MRSCLQSHSAHSQYARHAYRRSQCYPDPTDRGATSAAQCLQLQADSIGLSQPAASHALAKLRVQFDDPLFTRTPKGFQPTPYGERLSTAAQEAVAVLVAGITSGRQFDPRTTTRCFNLYASDVGQMVLLPKLLGYLRKAAPGASAPGFAGPTRKAGITLEFGRCRCSGGLLRQPHNRLPTIPSVPRSLCLRRAGNIPGSRRE